MAENSAISWTDHTFNPWWGCTEVGPGCDHCYARTLDKRWGGAHWGSGVARRLIKDWSAPVKWNAFAAAIGVRPWVFCASMADVFDNEVPELWRTRLWALVRATPHLNWIFVTKRIGNAAKMLPDDWPAAFPHCGLVATVCSQAEVDRDVPKLLATPAAWRGVSVEPLLGPIDFEEAWHGENALDSECWGDCAWCKEGLPPLHNCRFGKGNWHRDRSGLDWVIVGGESGPHARPMHPDWARVIRDQCAAAGVSFHFKQWGEWTPGENVDRQSGYIRTAKKPFHDVDWMFGRENLANTDGHVDDQPDVYRVGVKAAGRRLDGVEHNGMPPGPRDPFPNLPPLSDAAGVAALGFTS